MHPPSGHQRRFHFHRQPYSVQVTLQGCVYIRESVLPAAVNMDINHHGEEAVASEDSGSWAEDSWLWSGDEFEFSLT